MTNPKHNSTKVLLTFVAAYLVLDTMIALMFLLSVLNIFESIRCIYLSNFLIFPAIGLFYFLYTLRNKKTNFASIAILTISIAFGALYAYATHIEPRSIKVTEIEIPSDKIKTQLVIAHISDIQSARIGPWEQQVFKKLAQLNPDIIFHTGDLLQIDDPDEFNTNLTRLADLFKTLNPKYGIFNVLGNVDRRLKPGQIDELANVRTLINDTAHISDENLRLSILGLSYPQSMRGDKTAITQWQKDTTPDSFTIILGHAPDYVLDITEIPVDLCLAGHTHGGQVSLPLIGPLLNQSRTPKSWANGPTKLKHTTLNVSPGIGTEHAAGIPPIRFNCPPTISIIKMTPHPEPPEIHP